MFLKKGIVRKIFWFSTLLILIVTSISFAVMYFVMPGYYLMRKGQTLQGNLTALTQGLQAAETEEACAALISDFSEMNNVTVLSFNKHNALLPAISTPFLGIRGNNAVFFSEMRQTEMDGRQTVMVQIGGRNDAEDMSRDNSVSIKWAAASGGDVISLTGQVGTDIVDHVMVSGTLQPIDEAKGVILSLIPYVLAITIAVGLILSGIYAKQISKPILQISDAALRMQKMEPGIESGIKTNDELGRLSMNLDVLYANLLDNIGHLKSEMDKVNRLERSKTELMQNASHELKTPIAALNGMIEGMLDNIGVYKNKEKYLAECKGQVDKLSRLVAEILGASKADLSADELETSNIYIDELVERAIAENIYQIHEKGLKLEQELSPILITTDPNILYHTISNLVSNAVRYTPGNGAVRISITGEGTNRRLTIENECEPIPPEELPKLFEPFYTRSYSRDKAKSGTGLGLYIVKRSLERLEIPYEVKCTDFGFHINLEI